MKECLILNADDFGLSVFHNKAVIEGFKTGILTSASICANGEAFEDAVKICNIYKDFGYAVHLNIMEGRSLTSCPLLTDKNGFFNKSYGYLMLNMNNKELLKQIENEFEAQIKKTVNYINPDHLDSHVHTHAIPSIFNITCKLAMKYNIKFIRTQYEQMYLIPKQNLKLINIMKILLLQFFTLINRKLLKKYNLGTNDYIVGVGYTGEMNTNTVKYGLEALTNHGQNKITEVLIHPCKYDDTNIKNSHTVEFEITQDSDLKSYITNLNYILTNYKKLSINK